MNLVLYITIFLRSLQPCGNSGRQLICKFPNLLSDMRRATEVCLLCVRLLKPVKKRCNNRQLRTMIRRKVWYK